MKNTLNIFSFFFGAGIALLDSFTIKFPGYLILLIVLSACDYIGGISLGFMGKSKKTPNGGIESRYALKGIIRKLYGILLVGICMLLDREIGITYLARIASYSLCTTELISIIENYALMGGKVPQIFYTAIDILEKDAEPGEAVVDPKHLHILEPESVEGRDEDE